MWVIPLSLALIFVLLYMTFHNLPDALVVLSNVVALSLGGVWGLLLTRNNFSISAAVGFISIFGVAIMDGLLLVSYFNQMRANGLPVREAILQGRKRVRPVMMTALTAIFGLLPAALSTDRLAIAEAVGDRGGRRHDLDAVPDAVSDAGVVQLLRASRAASERGGDGSLIWFGAVPFTFRAGAQKRETA